MVSHAEKLAKILIKESSIKVINSCQDSWKERKIQWYFDIRVIRKLKKEVCFSEKVLEAVAASPTEEYSGNEKQSFQRNVNNTIPNRRKRQLSLILYGKCEFKHNYNNALTTEE